MAFPDHACHSLVQAPRRPMGLQTIVWPSGMTLDHLNFES
jgi:hypothetical protein